MSVEQFIIIHTKKKDTSVVLNFIVVSFISSFLFFCLHYTIPNKKKLMIDKIDY